MDYDLFQRLCLALAIGLLVGLERGWKARTSADGTRAAGIRTFGLIGLTGGICGLLALQAGGIVLGISSLGFMAVFGIFEWRRNEAENTMSATGFVAGALVFFLGAYVMSGDRLIAASTAVVATVLLAERERLHSFLRQINFTELQAALVLLVMTVVLLPVLPDRPVDPWQALNPFQLWLMMIFIAALSYAGYIAVRLLGPRKGLLFAGAAGGVISSTTVTFTLSQLAHKQSSLGANEIRTGITLAWMVSIVRMGLIAIIIAPALLPLLIAPMAMSIVILGIPQILFLNKQKTGLSAEALGFENPFEIWPMLRFGLLLCAIMLGAKLLSAQVQTTALIGFVAASGLIDVDPITLSIAKMSLGQISQNYALVLILVAGASNLVAKCAVMAGVGGMRFALPLIITTLSIFAVVGLWVYSTTAFSF